MVDSTLSYLAPMSERPAYYLFEPPPGTPWRNTKGDRSTVTIHDARKLDRPASLDLEGFGLARLETRVENLYDPDAVRDVYYAEVEALVAEVTGAARVLAFDHNVRNSQRAERSEDGTQNPVRFAHNDYT